MSWTSEQARALTRPHPVVLQGRASARCRSGCRRTGTPGSPPTTSRPPAWPGPSRSGSPAARAGRSGSTTTDELDDSSLREAVARSEALMAAARPDPEQVEGLGPQDYPADPRLRRGHRRRRPDPPPRRRQGRRSTAPAGRGLNASGFFETTAPLVGDRQQEGELRLPPLDRPPSTRPRCGPPTAPARAMRRSRSPRLSDIDAAALAERAATKAESSARPRDLPPGRYTVILEPAAVADLLDVPDLLAQRPRRRRGAELPLEARRRQPARREALRRRRDPPLRPVRPPQPGQALGRRRRRGSAVRRRRLRADSRPAGRPGSRTASSRPSPSTATGRARPRSSPSRSPAA